MTDPKTPDGADKAAESLAPSVRDHLSFLEQDMNTRPGSITPADDLLAEMEALVGDSVQDGSAQD